MDYDDANDELEDFDVIIVPGGEGVFEVLKNKSEPLQLLSKFVEMQEKVRIFRIPSSFGFTTQSGTPRLQWPPDTCSFAFH